MESSRDLLMGELTGKLTRAWKIAEVLDNQEIKALIFVAILYANPHIPMPKDLVDILTEARIPLPPNRRLSGDEEVEYQKAAKTNDPKDMAKLVHRFMNPYTQSDSSSNLQ